MYDVIFLGGGPGGYAGAVTASSTGLKTAVVEKKKVGGTCVNVGCIPADSALAAVDAIKYSSLGVFKENPRLDFGAAIERASGIAAQTAELASMVLGARGVDVIQGSGKVIDHGVQVNGETLEAKAVVLATGATPNVPEIEGIEPEALLTRDTFWQLREAPERVAVLEGGEPSSDALELAQILSAGGSKVKFLDENDEILPWEDADLAASLREALSSDGIDFSFQVEPNSISRDNQRRFKVTWEEGGEQKEEEFDAIMASYGWSPNVQGIGLEELGVETELGFVKVDELGRTNLPWLYAVGDATIHMSAASAMHMGRIVAMNIAGGKQAMDSDQFPRGCATVPELEAVGLTELGARNAGIQPVIGTADLQANEKAIAMGRAKGIVKVVADEKGNVIGGGLVGPFASEVVHELVLAMRAKASVLDLALTNYEHATISESLQEAALKAASQMGRREVLLGSRPRDLALR